MRTSAILSALCLAALLAACATAPGEETADPTFGIGGAADGWATERQVEVILTDPHCDLCTASDKDLLRARSRIIARVVELIDGAQTSVDIAQFTFSVSEIEEAILRAHGEGVQVRLAMNAAQDRDGSVARRLRDAGVDVRFVAGRPAHSEGGYSGLQHAKFMIVDENVLVTGSNNWSSTGTTINEENTLVFTSAAEDPLIAGFACHFEAIWAGRIDDAVGCSADGMAFTPGTAAIRLLRDGIRASETSIDVLMHHMLFDDLIKELAKAAERGVRVRVVVNAADRDEVRGRQWDRLLAAGGEVRFKQTNADTYQLMHHKLAIVDDRILLNGSGNWSGSAFFNNFENFVRYEDPRVVEPFERLFDRLWAWSLTAESLDAGRSAADQHAAETAIYFGNLHAHFEAWDGDRMLDDGRPEVIGPDGEIVPVDNGDTLGEAARYAYQYARDRGEMDFLALTPHTLGEGWEVPSDAASMSTDGYLEMLEVSSAVSNESDGEFLALSGFEWSTNGSGNHVNVLGATELATTRSGRFDIFYRQYLSERAYEGDRVFMMWNHPRTARVYEESLGGNWDQIFGVNLLDIPNGGQRRAKFNDYGLDDFAPMSDVRQDWIEGRAEPDEATVFATLENIRVVTEPYLRLMEVTIGRGTSIGAETPINPSLNEVGEDDPDGREAGTFERFTRVHRDWDYYLLRGFHLAPTASHDNHMANWGTGHTSRTGVLASELSEEGLLDAVDARAVFASEDQNLELRFDAAGRVVMGGSLAIAGESVDARLTLADPDYDGPFTITVYRGRIGDRYVEAAEALEVSGPGQVPLTLTAPLDGQYFFYVEVHEHAPDRMAWSAPIWVERLQ